MKRTFGRNINLDMTGMGNLVTAADPYKGNIFLCLCLFLYVWRYDCLSVYLSPVCLYLSVSRSFFRSAYLSVCLSVCLCNCLYLLVYLSLTTSLFRPLLHLAFLLFLLDYLPVTYFSLFPSFCFQFKPVFIP